MLRWQRRGLLLHTPIPPWLHPALSESIHILQNHPSASVLVSTRTFTLLICKIFFPMDLSASSVLKWVVQLMEAQRRNALLKCQSTTTHFMYWCEVAIRCLRPHQCSREWEVREQVLIRAEDELPEGNCHSYPVITHCPQRPCDRTQLPHAQSKGACETPSDSSIWDLLGKLGYTELERQHSCASCTLTLCGLIYFRMQPGRSTAKCNTHCPHSGINWDSKHWKTEKYFPSLVPGSNPQNPLGKGVSVSAPAPRFGFMRNCSHAPLRWACPKPECNESKASCFTSLATLNKLIRHSTANKP